MKKTGLLALMVSLAVTAGASAQASAQTGTGKQDPRAPEVKKPESQLKDPESWKTQKEKEQEKAGGKDASDESSADKKEPSKDGKGASSGSSRAAASSRAGAKSGRPASGWTDRAFISGNVGWQLSSKTFSDTRTLLDTGQVDPERRKFTASYETESGTTFDVGGAVRVWRSLGAGVAVTRYAKTNDIAIEGTVPHPFFFNRDRAVSGTADGTRNEVAVHVDAVWVVPVNPRMQVAVFGGPTFFNVKQTVVNDFSFTQQYPYDEATFSGARVTEESGSVTGFNAGADVAYYFTEVIGVGGIIRFSRGSFESGAGKIDVGGPEVGVGVRIRLPRGK